MSGDAAHAARAFRLNASGKDSEHQVDCAIVLAAGIGSRLRATHPTQAALAKPLTPVLGVPILVRTISTLHAQGAHDVIIVTGYEAEAVRTVANHPALGRLPDLRVTFTHNAAWRRQNGISVLTAREHVGSRRFLLSMGDHLYDRDLLNALLGTKRSGLVLAVDRRLGEIHDMEDAVKVVTDAEGRIAAISKQLNTFDAVDTGVFLADGALFDALDHMRAAQNGDCSLVDGVAQLARQGRAWTADIAAAWWQDVDDYGSLLLAEEKLRALETAA
jgi:choline kinase